MKKKEFEKLRHELINLYDKESELEHVKNVEKIAIQICKLWEVEDDFKQWICIGCIAHDIGKTKEVENWYEKNRFPKINHRIRGALYFSNKFDTKNYVKYMIWYHNGKVGKKSQKNLSKKAKTAIAIVHTADQIANMRIEKLME